MIEKNFVKMYEESFRKHWALPALANYDIGNSYSYAEMSQWVMKTHLVLAHLGVQKGEKVALIGKDSAEWCMAWMGIITYGAVIVPILPAFNPNDILNIIDHSDAVAVFAGEEHQTYINPERIPKVQTVLDIKTLTPLLPLSQSPLAETLNPDALFKNQYPNGFTKEDLVFPEISNNEVMLISYTSGTTGFSKGVITTANNLATNVVYTQEKELMNQGDRLLCFLPNAHAYSCAFNFLLPLSVGVQVFILGYKPTGTILLKALKDVRPRIILSVPLILEKIYKSVILPKISTTSNKIALSVPIVREAGYKKIRESLIEALGGELHEFIVGGAALNGEVLDFLTKIKFPLTVGYGMTECAPLISYEGHKKYVPHSCGKVLPKKYLEVRIWEPKEKDGEMVGEVQVRGENVCKGYYKDAQATEELFTADGWMHTGDLGYMDKHDNLFLKGRSKAMILSSDGQNIYPEEIEDRINMLPYMYESVVVQRERNRLVAIVTLDQTALDADGIKTKEQIEQLLEQNREKLNSIVATYEKVAAFELLDGSFEKTPKQSIKRFLYE